MRPRIGTFAALEERREGKHQLRKKDQQQSWSQLHFPNIPRESHKSHTRGSLALFGVSRQRAQLSDTTRGLIYCPRRTQSLPNRSWSPDQTLQVFASLVRWIPAGTAGCAQRGRLLSRSAGSCRPRVLAYRGARVTSLPASTQGRRLSRLQFPFATRRHQACSRCNPGSVVAAGSYRGVRQSNRVNAAS
jgi:hypothetical protein